MSQRIKACRKWLQAGLFLLVLMQGSVSSAQTWEKITPSGTAPPPLEGHTAVYAPDKGMMMVYGRPTSRGDSVSSGEFWRLRFPKEPGDRPTWIKERPRPDPAHGVPSGRAFHSAAYDALNDRMIIFGGALGDLAPCTDEVWVLVNASGADGPSRWQRLLPLDELPARQGHTAVYDPASNRMIVVGGNDCANTEYSDTFILTHANGLGGTPIWKRLPPSPWRRRFHSAVYDEKSNRMIVFAGDEVTGIGRVRSINRSNEVWVLNNANNMKIPSLWERLSPRGIAPPARAGHTAIYDPKTNRMIIFGGDTGKSSENDIWILIDANEIGSPAWIKRSPFGIPPFPRGHHTAAYDPERRRIIVVGSGTEAGARHSAAIGVWVLAEADGVGNSLPESGHRKGSGE